MKSVYEPPAKLTDVTSLLWSHKGKMLLVFLCGIGLTVVLLSGAQRRYKSEAKILVRADGMNLDPTMTTGQFVALSRSDESEVHAVEELLSSRALAEQIVEQLGTDLILEREARGDEGSADGRAWLGSLAATVLGPSSAQDQAVRHLSESLSVSAGKSSNVITVAYEAEDPKLAQSILDSLLQHARQQYLRIHQTEGAQTFLTGQMELYADELTRLEEQLRNLKDQTGFSSLATQRDSRLQLIGTLTQSLVLAQTDLDAATAEVQQRAQQLAQVPTMVVTQQTTGQPQNSSQTLREKLYELEITEQELTSRFTDRHPQVIQIRRQIEEARRIARAEPDSSQVVRSTNQSHQTAELAIQERVATVSALQARIESLQQKISAASEELARVNAAEVEITRLEREIELAQANHRKYAESVEQARINQELEAAQISRLNLMQAPTLVLTPTSPRPKLILAMGFMGSLMSSVGVALLAHQRKTQRIGSRLARAPAADSPLSFPDSPNPPPRRVAAVTARPR